MHSVYEHEYLKLSHSAGEFRSTVECAAGTYYNVTTETCPMCPRGTYQSVSGQDHCVPCPAGYMTEAVGGQQVSHCKRKSVFDDDFHSRTFVLPVEMRRLFLSLYELITDITCMKGIQKENIQLFLL